MADTPGPKKYDSSDTVPIPDEVLARFRESESCRVATPNDVVEEIVRNAAGPERVTCPCCGMPDSVTPERIVDYLNFILFGSDAQGMTAPLKEEKK